MDEPIEQATANPGEKRNVSVTRTECAQGEHDVMEDSAGDIVCLTCGAVWVRQ